MIILKRVFSRNIISKEYIAQGLKNYNIEENFEYTKKYYLAKEQRENLINKVNNNYSKTKKKVVYDRPRADYDISNYFVWREFDEPFEKDEDFHYNIATRINVSPHDLRMAFGEPKVAYRNTITYSTGEYDFMDTNLDQFMIYDSWVYEKKIRNKRRYSSTSIYEEGDLNVQDERIKKFWESKDKHEFRVNCSYYADFHKFKTFIYKEIERVKESGVSFEETAISKYGKFDLENEYNNEFNYKEALELPTVYKVDKTFFESGLKIDAKDINYINYKKHAKKLDDKYLI